MDTGTEIDTRRSSKFGICIVQINLHKKYLDYDSTANKKLLDRILLPTTATP